MPKCSLTNPEISRYSRQLILPEIGVQGQRRLLNSSVLIVGCGGLGCPVAQYLSAQGVGRIGLVDHDLIEESNLHRQTLHTEKRIGTLKSRSIHLAIKDINSKLRVDVFNVVFSSKNALEIVKGFDVIVDATDNVATRYLINDACVLAKKPLVSGSALRFEGQLAVYNFPPDVGVTYRCLFPEPPPVETVTNCSDGGVLGVVPGIIGCLQALEVVKVIVGLPVSYAGRMLLFNGLFGSFRNIKLRPRTADANITKLIDYQAFCGSLSNDAAKVKDVQKSTSDKHRISVTDYSLLATPHVLIDVRPRTEMDIASLESAINIPLKEIDRVDNIKRINQLLIDEQKHMIVVVCHRGNDSQLAVSRLCKILPDMSPPLIIKDIVGGLHAWNRDIDESFPIY